MSSAGQANEAGSVFRRDAALYFAVHALADVSIGSLPGSSPIERIDFETADPTDDIRIGRQDGSRIFMSAKRAAGLDDHTRDTVEGWVGQVSSLSDGDLLVLGVSEASGPLRELQQALNRARATVPRPVDAPRLQWLDDLVPPEHRQVVRDRAHIIEFARTPTSADEHNRLVMMMNNLVEDQEGAAALDCLAAHFHTTAGTGSGSGIAEWVLLLENRGFRLRPAASHGRAVRDVMAVHAYRRALLKEQGVINLSILADDLGALEHPNILDGVRVTDPSRERSTSRDLRPVLRRKRRLLVIGQPGTGKTKTLWELAAWCVEDENAPEPIRVKLSRLIKPERPDSLELADLVAEAATLTPLDDQARVRAHLMEAAATGDAILLLDGLDECGEHVSWVAEELKTLTASLHSDTAMVVATRPSAEMPARRLSLDEVVLESPQDLKTTMDAVLQLAASTRIRDAERHTWLAERRAWLKEAIEEQEAMLRVPQLAILVVLLAANPIAAEVPQSRAAVLHEAVHQSVQRWELRRFADGHNPWSTDLMPAMLLDGFVTLGRLLDGQADQSKSAALAALDEMLRDPEQWAESPARARELAAQVLLFWDDHVGVFTVDESDLVSARSRVFCEVATAMWVSRSTEVELRTWVRETVPFYDAQGVIALAQGLDPRVSDLLLEVGEADPIASLAVGQAVLANIQQPNADGLARLVGQLRRHALDVEGGDTELPERINRPGVKALDSWQKRKDYGPRSWTLVEVLCRLDLPASLRTQRAQAIVELQLAQSYPGIARSTAALVEARADARTLMDSELRDVQEIIDIALPERVEPIQTRRHMIIIGESEVPLGLSLVVELAADHLPELAPGSDRKLYELSQRVGFRDGWRIVRRLRRAGVAVELWEGPSPVAGFVAAFANHAEHERTLLADIATLGRADIDLSPVDRWSLRELGDLLYATGYEHAGIAAFAYAVTRDNAQVRRAWLRSVAVVHRLDLDPLAAQAQYVLTRMSAGEETPRFDEWTVISENPAFPGRSPNFSLMGDLEQQAAIAGLYAHSDWIVHSVMWLLFQTTASWDREALFDEPIGQWSPTRASNFRQVAIVAQPPSHELLTRAAGHEHPVYRHAARRAIQLTSALDADDTIHAQLAADPDLWVRVGLQAGGPVPPAEYWSCPWCPCRNAARVEDCRGCVHGTRPKTED